MYSQQLEGPPLVTWDRTVYLEGREPLQRDVQAPAIPLPTRGWDGGKVAVHQHLANRLHQAQRRISQPAKPPIA